MLLMMMTIMFSILVMVLIDDYVIGIFYNLDYSDGD